jgi:hypothetical protein
MLGKQAAILPYIGLYRPILGPIGSLVLVNLAGLYLAGLCILRFYKSSKLRLIKAK